MRSLSVRLLLSFLTLILVPTALAHDITLTGTSTFAALDGSSSDHDGSANGVFTVDDLLNCTRDDLLSISNFGEKTLEEVYKALENVGFYRPGRTHARV